MKSTRDRILENLLTYPRSTINDMAEAVGINAISVRHHLTSLQAEGLVITEEERHGVGRPRLVYYLSENGVERFPTHYLKLTNRLIDLIKSNLPEQTTQNLFKQMGMDLASSYYQKAQSLPFENRIQLVVEALKEECFIIEWEKKDEKFYINAISCPFFHIGQSHSELCLMDQTLISNLMGVPAERVKCLLDGEEQCTYIISPPNKSEKPK